jgi:uncharacterized membrane protein
MKGKLFSLFIAVFLLVLPKTIFAQQQWLINNFASTIAIQSDGKVAVKETIAVDFGTTEKHGIYRNLPSVYKNTDGSMTYTHLTVQAVKRNGTNEPYSLDENGSQLEVKIGSAKRTVTGKQVYTLTYLATGVLRSFPNYDEVYWNATGNDWDTTIQQASATVTLPKDGMKQSACYVGAQGSTQQCQTAHTDNQATFSTDQLSPGDGMTIAAGFEKGMVPILTVAKPKSFVEQLFSLPNIVLFVFIVLAGGGLVIYRWLRFGRDYWSSNVPFTDRTSKGAIRPIGAHETVTVEFTPPDKLRPAEIGVLMDERADTLDVTATIIDLATRGFLTIEEVNKKWLFGKKDYVLHKTTKKPTGLLPYEQELHERLFDDKSNVAISDLKQEFYTDLKTVKDKLYDDVVAKNFFATNPQNVRNRYLIAGILLTVMPLILFIMSSSFLSPTLSAAAAGVSVVGVVLLVFSRFMSARTNHGHELYLRARGYKHFINGAETYRQRFYEKHNLFDAILPYAIVFGLTEKFAKAMKQMGVEPENPSWYTGTTPFQPYYFASQVQGFSNSLSSAMAATPSSSGSGGGGFSGGGFGGGGGSSW